MKRLVYAGLFVMLGGMTWAAVDRFHITHPVSGQDLVAPGRDGTDAMLPNGWKTTPAGRALASGDMILSGQVSPDGKLFAFTNTGYTRHGLHIVDVASEKEIATFPLSRAWSGLAFSADGRRIFLSSGAGNPASDVQVFDRCDNGGWADGRGGFKLYGAVATAVSSITLSADGTLLYILNNSDESLYIVDAAHGRAVSRVKVGDHPIAARLSKDGNTLYVANIGDATIAIVDVRDPGKPSVTGTLKTDPHPNDLVLSTDDRLFVSCGNTNNVIAFDLKTSQRLEVINTALGPKAPAGSTPNALALSPDGKTLYVANADNNSLSVVDVSDRGKSRPLGFVPTGWYPTFVTTTPDGKRLIVASSKGVGTGPNRVKRPIDPIAPNSQHHGFLMNGLVSFIDTPDAATLTRYTQQVYDNARYRDALLETSGAGGESIIPTKVGDPSPIKHVLFIMKENRTYDQVLGDLKQGNGDPSLTLFGRDVTPNQHAIAEQFVLLDNLYCSGEVSQDGWYWTMSAYAGDINQRAWTLGYSGHGSLKGPANVQDQSTPYIWELARAHGLTVKTFGIRDRRGLEGIQSTRFDLARPRLDPSDPNFAPAAPRPQRDRDYLRADRFIEEFREMDRDGTVPAFMFMSLGENHTSGTAPGAYTPKAQVASNDLAVGKIVEAISQSKAWSSFAIFIIEDDAQNGPDHVDSHRTAGLVVSPYVKRTFVDSTMYSTVSMLRTIELLLGLPPMTQHDAAAQPMVNSFMRTPNLAGFKALPARIDLMTMNPSNGYGATESARMDFSDYDRIDEDVLNRILWHSVKGVDVPYPAPVRQALPTPFGLLRFPKADADDNDNDND